MDRPSPAAAGGIRRPVTTQAPVEHPTGRVDLKLEHLLDPLQSVGQAKQVFPERWRTREFVRRGERHFAGDRRYDFRAVLDGFASRIDDSAADESLFERICASYQKAAQLEQTAPETYRASSWWQERREGHLKPVIDALLTHDIAALRKMYKNFYRDPCSAGLVIAQRLAKRYFGHRIKDLDRRLYLLDSLYRLDYWQQAMGDGFSVADLFGPSVGNPFGVVIDGVLVRSGAEYQHYCAHRIGCLAGSEKLTVAEIGGGFGGMAYYLLRDRPGTTYIGFDVPESIALTTYYLLKSFPSLKVLLYGEAELTRNSFAEANIVLMPVFQMPAMPQRTVDVSFSSHAMSALSQQAMTAYIEEVRNMTKHHLLYIGNSHSLELMLETVRRRYPSWELVEKRRSGRHDHRIDDFTEMEFSYRFRG